MSVEGDQTAREALADLKEDGQRIVYRSLQTPADPEAEEVWDTDVKRYKDFVAYTVFDSRSRAGVAGGHPSTWRAICYIGIYDDFTPKQYDRIIMLDGKELAVIAAELYYEQDSAVLYRLEVSDG